MALKTKVKRENVVSEEDGNVEWITDEGKMLKLPATDVQIIEQAPAETKGAVKAQAEDEATAEEKPAEPEAPPAKPKKERAPPKAKQAATPVKAKVTAAPAPETAPPESKPKKADKPSQPKESTVAKAKKKSTAKGVRTIGGKEVDLSNYAKVKTAGGGVSFHNGDSTAKKLEGRTLDETYKIVARDTKQDEADLRKKYKHLNPGMQRMALGNMHRKGPREAKPAKVAKKSA